MDALDHGGTPLLPHIFDTVRQRMTYQQYYTTVVLATDENMLSDAEDLDRCLLYAL